MIEESADQGCVTTGLLFFYLVQPTTLHFRVRTKLDSYSIDPEDTSAVFHKSCRRSYVALLIETGSYCAAQDDLEHSLSISV